ncbi:hypothetical protein NBE98_16110 [Clostridium swellfunianum]|uniref:hypothetical protein n=1 Tax=Clostridium swellfunianum TaxID=1367462 RepID=UPI00202FE1CF|nr:hypothetical protein [Clostridium swellfunianum]MCM0649892.1 hypothetical protein [Clostridium swellfunianum]
MELLNRGFSNLLVAVLIFAALAFFINILPVIVVIGISIWGISYVYKKVKAYFIGRKSVFRKSKDEVEIINNMDLSESNIIDVDYTEVE